MVYATRPEHTSDTDPALGREAAAPQQIPPRGWRGVLYRVVHNYANDNLALAAAGLAFYAMLAVFPGLIAIISMYGLAADPGDVEKQMEAIAGTLPESARTLLAGQLNEIVSKPKVGLGIGAIVSILGFLWTAASGTKSLLLALNIAYHERQKRSWLRLTALSLAFTVGLILAVVVGVAAITVLPQLLRALGLGETAATAAAWFRWPALFVGVTAGLALLYRFGPDRRPAQFQWVSWGAAIAAVLWLVASLLFSWYASSFSKLNETYGALGGVIILLMWFYLSGLAILFGAELNAELEHQTNKDSTIGKPKPMGRRGAVVADTVGRPATV